MLQNEFGIPMTVEINEEMIRMCNLSEALIDKGREEGMEQGMKKGIEKGERRATLNHVRNLMEKMKLDVFQAFDVLGIPESDRGHYLKDLQND